MAEDRAGTGEERPPVVSDPLPEILISEDETAGQVGFKRGTREEKPRQDRVNKLF
jgi:hypothetical protein